MDVMGTAFAFVFFKILQSWEDPPIRLKQVTLIGDTGLSFGISSQDWPRGGAKILISKSLTWNLSVKMSVFFRCVFCCWKKKHAGHVWRFQLCFFFRSWNPAPKALLFLENSHFFSTFQNYPLQITLLKTLYTAISSWNCVHQKSKQPSTSWWLNQPISKIWSSNWIISPQNRGESFKKFFEKHHLENFQGNPSTLHYHRGKSLKSIIPLQCLSTCPLIVPFKPSFFSPPWSPACLDPTKCHASNVSRVPGTLIREVPRWISHLSMACHMSNEKRAPGCVGYLGETSYPHMRGF